MLRLGVPNNSDESGIEDVATWQLDDLRDAHDGTVFELFGYSLQKGVRDAPQI